MLDEAGLPPGATPAGEPALLPSCSPSPSDDAGCVPLAGGRRLRAVCWVSGPGGGSSSSSSAAASSPSAPASAEPGLSGSLLLLAAPHPEPGMEDGAGDVLLEVAVHWPGANGGSSCNGGGGVAVPEVEFAERQAVVYAGGRVLRMAPHAAGGVAVQLAGGQVLRYASGCTALQACGPRAQLPGPCPWVQPTPAAVLAASQVRRRPGPGPGWAGQGERPPLRKAGAACRHQASCASSCSRILVCGYGCPA